MRLYRKKMSLELRKEKSNSKEYWKILNRGKNGNWTQYPNRKFVWVFAIFLFKFSLTQFKSNGSIFGKENALSFSIGVSFRFLKYSNKLSIGILGSVSVFTSI
jgi:hypothetical protein